MNYPFYTLLDLISSNLKIFVVYKFFTVPGFGVRVMLALKYEWEIFLPLLSLREFI